MSLSLQTIETVEDGGDSEEEYYMAVQQEINSGTAWSLQGSHGRAMMNAIECGACMLGESGAHDYWGNYIPSRYEVQEGTKGSRQYVVDRQGENWAFMQENV